MTKIKMLRFTTDLNVITPAVEHPIQEWLNENKGISVVSITSSSRETMDGNTPVLAWDVTITYEPKKKLVSKTIWIHKDHAQTATAEIEKWRKSIGIDGKDIVSIQIVESPLGVLHGNLITYLVEDTDG